MRKERCRCRWLQAAAILLTLLVAIAAAYAAPIVESDNGTVDLGGDLKSYFFAIDSKPPVLADPLGLGMLDGRLALEASYGRALRLTAHHVVSGESLAGGTLLVPGIAAGLAGGGEVPQALDLSWTANDAAGFQLGGRTDRLMLLVRLGRVDLTLGRQPVTFGTTYFFTPLDLVAPFSPTVVDREYKPGYDAARADVYWGTAGKLTLVAAYAGEGPLDGKTSLDDSVLAAYGGTTVGGYDLRLFGAASHGEPVLGGGVSGSVGGAAVRAEGSVTWPKDGAAFARVAAGADYRFESGLTVLGEVYYQSLGKLHAANYPVLYVSERYARGEIWAVGRAYAALNLDYELTPLLHAGGYGVVNFGDASALVGLTGSWSVADNADVVVGGYRGLGDNVSQTYVFQSEFGMTPTVAYVEMKAYF